MLRKYSNSRTLKQNIQLGGITAFAAGMVNVSSVIAFFAFTSNMTGHVAIFAEEIAKGHWYQAFVVLGWISLFVLGGFISNYSVITLTKWNGYIAHGIPLFLEMLCLLAVGVYGSSYYRETLQETEYLIALLIFAMGLQNGLTASISNSTVKTTHLTGLLTDLATTIAMFTKTKFRKNVEVIGKAKLLTTILVTYIIGGIVAGLIFIEIEFKVFYVISFVLFIVLNYDLITLFRIHINRKRDLSKKLTDSMLRK